MSVETSESPSALSNGRSQGAGKNVLIVDHEESTREVLARLLDGNGYDSTVASDVDQARDRMREREFAVVLTDMNLPGMSGLDLLVKLMAEYPDTATVMVTDMEDTRLAGAAVDIGAYGYVVKPFHPDQVLISVGNALRRRALEIENRGHRQRLEEMVRERTSELWDAIARLERVEKELRESQEETIRRLSIAAEFRDDETARHIQRMSRYCALLARSLNEDSQRCESIRVASQMHDVGKIGISDDIVLKPGVLTPEERAVMENHTNVGYRILSGSSSPLLETAATIALTHHERFDGTGYPRGISGQQIPIEGRIAALADAFDALTTDRVYKKAVPLGEALDLMQEGRGTQFDPVLLELFLSSIDAVVAIKAEFADT